MKFFLKKYTSEYILQQTQKEGYTGNLLFTPNELIIYTTLKLGLQNTHRVKVSS